MKFGILFAGLVKKSEMKSHYMVLSIKFFFCKKFQSNITKVNVDESET